MIFITSFSEIVISVSVILHLLFPIDTYEL